MRLKSLSARLFVVTAVALAPAIAIAVASVTSVQREQTADLHTDALRAAELVTMETEQTFTGVESVLRTIAAAPVTRNAFPAACSRLLSDAVDSIDALSALHIVNADGEIRCSSSWQDAEIISAQDYFKQALETGQRTTGTLAEVGAFDRPRLPIALRIGGTDGAPAGVAVAYLNLDWVEQGLQKRSLPEGGSVTIVDRSGTILARVPEPDGYVGTKILESAMHLLAESAPGTEELVSRDGTQRLIGYFPPAANETGLYISAGLSVEAAYAPLRRLIKQAGVLALLGAVLAAVLAFYTARVFIAGPVGVLLDTVGAWRRGDTSARTNMAVDDGEIFSAGASLDAFMTELLANREARKKSDEARELMRDELEHREKNLLATVQAVARQTFSQLGNDGALRVFSDRLNAISEANRLLKNSGWESTPLRSLVTNGVATFIVDHNARVETRGPDLVVKGNVATAIAMSIHELCTNAVKYGALSNDTGKVLIEWEVQPNEKGGTFVLKWTERGGPPVIKPKRTGFGSKVIKHALSAQTGGSVEITHDQQGLVCRLTAPAEAVIASAG